MRLGIACVLVGTGCNQIFGSHSVNELYSDAGPPADASPYSMQITGMAWDSGKVSDPSGILPTFPVLPSVTVEIGAMAPATAAAFPALSPAAVDSTGTFLVPFELALEDYRVVYHPPDGVPVEYQTSLHTPHHFIASVDIGRADKVLPASDAALSPFFPQSTPGSYSDARLIETGSWATVELGAADPANTSIKWSQTLTSTSASHPFGPVASQDGPLYAPETQKGDRLLLVDSTNGIASAYSSFTLEGFNGAQPNGLIGTAWNTSAPQVAAKFSPLPSTAAAVDRVSTDTRGNSVSFEDNPVAGVNAPAYWSGVIPSAAMPNFLAPGAGGKVSAPAQANGIGGMDLPTFAFMSTNNTGFDAPYVDVFNGTIAPKFPQAFFARLSRSRTTAGVKLTEGVQTIALTAGGTAPIDLGIGLPYLGGAHMMFGGVDIWNNLDTPWPIPATPGLLPFSFGVDGPVDDCVTTLYRVTAAVYTPVRRYLMPAPSGHGAPPAILVDAALMPAGQPFAFGVTCHLGYPNAAVGDWSKVTYPFSESVLYSFLFMRQ